MNLMLFCIFIVEKTEPRQLGAFSKPLTMRIQRAAHLKYMLTSTMMYLIGTFNN
jgi:hypothetical protein